MEIFDFIKPIFETSLVFVRPGLIYGIGSIGLALSLRFLKFPDFTVLGSIMVGGVICISASTYFNNSFLGILFGACTGGFLGLITGFISRYIRIQKVLASIITFTGAYSLGFIFTVGGQVALPEKMPVLLHSDFDINDVVIILIISFFLCSIFAFIVTTKYGSLLLAMLAEKDYLQFRHRFRNTIFISTLFIGNFIVGLCGALFALMTRSASVYSHYDFLPVALGAIFGGNAITIWFSKKLHKDRVEDIANDYDENDSSQNATIAKKGPGKILRALYSIFSIDRLDSKKVGLLFFSYILGCLFLSVIQGVVHTKADFSFAHILVALLITFFVWWAGYEDND